MPLSKTILPLDYASPREKRQRRPIPAWLQLFSMVALIVLFWLAIYGLVWITMEQARNTFGR